VTKRMVFENQTPTRKAQNMAAILAVIVLIGVLISAPVGAGFADWINSVNAPDSIDQKYIETNEFDFDGTNNLGHTTGYKPYFYWWNGTGTKNKHNITTATYRLTPDLLSTDGNQYDNSDTSDDGPDWDEGVPYWEIYFNYTALDAYKDNIVQIRLNLDSCDSCWENCTHGRGLLSAPDASDGDDREPVTVTLSAGDITFFKETLSSSEDGTVEEQITVDVNDLRRAIINEGVESFFVLKVTGHDVRQINMQDSGMYAYNVQKLFDRDDGLYLACTIAALCSALGIFLVQPRYNLPFETYTRICIGISCSTRLLHQRTYNIYAR